MSRLRIIIGLIFVLPALITAEAQVFSSKQEIGIADNPQVIKSADFNGDGYGDIVYSSLTDHKIAVALYNPEMGNFDEEHLVTTDFNYAVSLFAADLDGDTFVDLLTVSQLDHKVAWFKNDGASNFTLQPLISDDAQGAISVIATDIDGDNDNDVIAASKNDNTIQWYENTDGNGAFSEAHIITTSGEFPVVIISEDIDHDEDADIIAGKLAGNEIVWFPNDGTGNFGEEQLITGEINFISSLYADDLNGDSYIDILSASRSDNKIAWYENLDGNGNFSSQQLIAEDFTMAYDVVAADFDLDGDRDVVSSAMGGNLIQLFNNSDGAGSFVPAQFISEVCEQPKGLTTADFDDDGDVDIGATHAQQDPDEVVWYENGAATFTVHPINQNRDVWRITLEDITNDGNKDIFYTDGQVVCWIENMSSGQSFGDETILFQGYNIYELMFNDIDQDNDQDLFIADAMGDKVLWLENLDGNGTFSDEIVIDDKGDGPADIDFSDVDGDGDDDLLVFFVNESTVAIFENTDGQGAFSKTNIATIGTTSGCFIDMDMDNDDDIAFSTNDDIQYMENDGAGNFSNPQTIAGLGYSWKILPAFMTGDNYPDLVYAPDYDLHWLENNQNMTFDDQAVEMWGSVMDFAICDMDNDGDPDVLSACRSVDLVNVSENINQGDTLITGNPFNVFEANAIETGDLNNDGWDDAVVGSWPTAGLYWAENYRFRILTHPADQYACQGEDAFFSVVSAGVEEYQWQVNTGDGFTDIEDNDVYTGTDKAQLFLSNIPQDLFSNEYRCKMQDKNGLELITEAAVLYDDCVNAPGSLTHQQEIHLYPNPTTGIIHLPEVRGINRITIQDVTGKVMERKLHLKPKQLDISGFEDGIYIIRIQTQKGVLKGKIVKQ
ncbi:MAG: T9SS type A sorting domain-containing protein [Bacteroidales bacterium]|nr:T9SS type A sorting domain-containing protein [Bacteroidales bacterium]